MIAAIPALTQAGSREKEPELRMICPVIVLALAAMLAPLWAQHPREPQVKVAIEYLRARGLIGGLLAEYERDPGQMAQLGDVIIATYDLLHQMPPNLEPEFRALSGRFDALAARCGPLPDSFAAIARRTDTLRSRVLDGRKETDRLEARVDSFETSTPLHVTMLQDVRPSVAGVSVGAVLGLASYLTSVRFDNVARDNLKAYTMTADSTRAAKFALAVSRSRALGDFFYCASYPLVAVGFYAGLSLARKMLPEHVSLLDENSPTRVCCSMDDRQKLSIGLARGIW